MDSCFHGMTLRYKAKLVDYRGAKIWHSAHRFQKCGDKVREFHEKYPNKPREGGIESNPPEVITELDGNGMAQVATDYDTSGAPHPETTVEQDAIESDPSGDSVEEDWDETLYSRHRNSAGRCRVKSI